MNICFVNERFNRRGGVGRVVVEIANSLQEDGFSVSLVDFSGENKYTYPVNKEIKIEKVISRFSFTKKILKKIAVIEYLFIKKSIKVNKIYKKQISELMNFISSQNINVLILCQGLLTSMLPTIKNKFPYIKIIAWQHNEYDIYVDLYYKKYIDSYKFGLRDADLVVCLTKEDQVKFSKINNDSTYIYNPITINNNSKKISDLKSKNIIFVGRLLMRQKGLDYLVQIAKNIPDKWRILIAGEGKDKKKFKKIVHANRLDDKIILEGNLNSNELMKLYLSGSIFISTSRWEGFGLVITEAMAFGLPIISFDNSGPKEILDDNGVKNGILVKKRDISGFIQNVNELINSYAIRKKYQRKSLIRVQDFKKEKIIKLWEHQLEKLTEKR